MGEDGGGASGDERFCSEGSCDTVTISCNACVAATLNVNYRRSVYPVVLQCHCESSFIFLFL